MDRRRRDRAIEELREDPSARVGRRRSDRGLGVFAGLGPALRRLRHRRGLSQRELARRAGVSRAMISCYEHETHLPSLPTLGRLLAGLELSPADLVAALAEPPRTSTGGRASKPRRP